MRRAETHLWVGTTLACCILLTACGRGGAPDRRADNPEANLPVGNCSDDPMTGVDCACLTRLVAERNPDLAKALEKLSSSKRGRIDSDTVALNQTDLDELMRITLDAQSACPADTQ